MSESSPSSAASRTIFASDGGGVSPRSTLLRNDGSTPIRAATRRTENTASVWRSCSRRARMNSPNGDMMCTL